MLKNYIYCIHRFDLLIFTLFKLILLFLKLLKSPEEPEQEIYPTPPTSIKPDIWYRPSSLTISQTTANALKNMQASYGKSEYSRKYTGHGTTSPKKLDNNNEVYLTSIS